MLASTLYYKIPLRLHWIVSPFILCFRLLRDLKLKVWIVVGEEHNSGMPLSILYAGNEINENYPVKNYLVGIIFGASLHENYLGREWLWNIPKKIAHEGRDCSLMLIKVIKPLRKLLRTKNCHYIPAWVYGEIDIPCSFSVMKNESLKSDLRRIKNNALGFEVTRETQYFNDFYYNMYVPYITKAHGNSAFVAPYEEKRTKFQNCDLLLVKKQETYIAGILIVYSKSGPSLWSLGIRDGNPQFVRDGAVAALYHFSFKYLEDKGFTKVKSGNSRAFLRDGVLQYKRKWSQKIIGTSRDWFVLKVLSYQGAAGSFLQENPFIFEKRGCLHGAVFVDGHDALSHKEIKKIYKQHYHPGLATLFIYRLGHRDIAKQDNIPPELSERIVLCSVEDMLGSM
jgi:hypothetical protein